MQVADRIHRLGSRYVNFYVVEDGSGVTVVDGGLDSYYEQVPALMNELGRPLTDITAIVQTHVHSDHVGITERLRAESGATVYVHELEGPVLTGKEKLRGPKGIGKVIADPKSYSAIAHILTRGGTKYPTVERVATFEDGDVLDVPGALKVVFTPGHSDGHCSLLCEDRGVLFSGDAIVTRNLRGHEGPRLMDLNADKEAARKSLDRFDSLQAEVILPGHGDPWKGSPTQAATLARGS